MNFGRRRTTQDTRDPMSACYLADLFEYYGANDEPSTSGNDERGSACVKYCTRAEQPEPASEDQGEERRVVEPVVDDGEVGRVRLQVH